MTVAEVIGLLSKVQSMAGDLPVVFKAVEGEAETVLHKIGLEIAPGDGTATGTVTVVHGPEAVAAVEPTPAPDPAPAPPAQ